MTLHANSFEADQPQVDDLRIRADVAMLAGRLYRTPARPRAVVVLHGATGVPQRYYRAFATWLTEQGLACLTYDYRDFGASLHGSMRASQATMADWGLRDQAAAQIAAEAEYPGVPVWVIGHSLGGFMLPYQPGASRLARVITVASGLADVRAHPWPYQAVARMFWYGAGPLLVRLCGYMPGEKLRLGADIPAGVYWQWRRWCTSPAFTLADVGKSLPVPDWNAVSAPVKFVAIADDDLMPVATVWRLMQYYPNAPKRQLVIRPGDFGLRKIGHLGVLSRRSAAVWPSIIA